MLFHFEICIDLFSNNLLCLNHTPFHSAHLPPSNQKPINWTSTFSSSIICFTQMYVTKQKTCRYFSNITTLRKTIHFTSPPRPHFWRCCHVHSSALKTRIHLVWTAPHCSKSQVTSRQKTAVERQISTFANEIHSCHFLAQSTCIISSSTALTNSYITRI